MVERRDQVLMTSFLLAAFNASTFFIKEASTNAPFFKLLAMFSISFRDYLPFLRRTINLPLAFLLFLVLTPNARLPHGVLGASRPTGHLPSPPPCG